MNGLEQLLASAVPPEEFTAPMALLHDRARARVRRRLNNFDSTSNDSRHTVKS